MATTVPNNPFDTQPKASGSTGLVGNAMSGGATQGANAAQLTVMAGVPNINATTYAPQTREVNRATETAAGQVESLLAKDNPLMQRARTLATQGMNKRGLVNSSINQGAGVAAMIDRITPIAQQDAQTFSNRTLANQQTVNEAGQFNASEINKFGLQKADQAFTANENATNRQFQTGERVGSQTFTAEQNKAAQDFQSAQSQLDRAQQTALADKSIEAEKALQNAQQVFQGAQSELDRVNQKVLQESQQKFTASENSLDRTQQVTLQKAQQDFTAAQSALQRAQEVALADKSIAANAALQTAQQNFTKAENVLTRAQEATLAEKSIAANAALADKNIAANASLQTAQQTYTTAQNALDRAQQLSITDKSIAANQALETARQTFTKAENELSRAQDVTMTDKQIAANQALETARQTFTATQSSLDRQQQVAITNLTNNLNTANVSKTFAGNLALSASNAVAAIAGDGNLTPEAKTGAIQNVIDNANNTMQWGSTFYNTTLPTISSPGKPAGAVTPGPGAGGGAPTSAPVNTAANPTINQSTANPNIVTKPVTPGGAAQVPVIDGKPQR